jgi:phosphoribosylamine--glycine ligase
MVSRWKGVLIIQDLAEAKEELRNMLVHQNLEKPVQKVIEEFLDGIELLFLSSYGW